MKARYLFSLLLSFNFLISFAQKPPIKFGEVDIKDLEMKVYLKDTSASAVILCHYGFFSSTNLEFNELLRIKILKKDGYRWADQTFPAKFQYNVKGYTVNLENGKVIKEKLKSESIFNTKVTDGVFETRFTMPDVKVGSVLDLEFSYRGIPFIWRFQEMIPVMYNELIMENGPLIKFKSNFFGYEPLAYSSPTKWIAKDMPAFKEEPYIDSKENYITKREFDIFELPGSTVPYAATWAEVNTNLLLSRNFRFFYATSPELSEIVRAISKSKKSKQEMLEDAFEAVKILKWNDESRLYTTGQTLNSVLKTKVGNSADINSFLYEVLKDLGIEVYPVAISTRENGKISLFTSSLNKLNYMIVLARVEGKGYLLDATEQYSPYYLLPLRNLNAKGRIIDPTNSDWIDLTTDRKEKESLIYDYKIDEDLNLKGTLSIVREDYAAFDFRKDFKKFNSTQEYLDNFITNKPGLIISDYVVRNTDSIYLPVTEKFNFIISNHVIQNGSEIQLIPFLFHQLSENPFKQEIRKYPVDFGYCKERTMITNLHLPEGYSVSQLPSRIDINLPDNSATYHMECEQVQNSIKISSSLLINKPVFLITEYNELRKLFNLIITKQAEPVVLKKKQL